MSLKSQTRDPWLKVPPRGLVQKKIHRPQLDLNLWTLDLEANTLSWDHRDDQIFKYVLENVECLEEVIYKCYADTKIGVRYDLVELLHTKQSYGFYW